MIWLLQEVEEGREVEDAAGGAECGLVGNLGLGEIGGCFSGVRGNESIFLGTEIDLFLIEETLAEIDLIQGVAVEDALDADLGERTVHLNYGLADIVAGDQRGIEVLQGSEGVAGSVGEQLAARNTGIDGVSAGNLDRGRVGVAVVCDRVGGGVESERLRGNRGARENVGSLVGGVRKAQQLGGQALDFTCDGLTVRGAERAVGAFGANGDGAGEDGDDVAEGRVADLQAGLQGADILQELVVLRELAVIAHQCGHRSGIVGELIDATPGGELLGGGIHADLALLDGSQQIRKKIGIETNRHD